MGNVVHENAKYVVTELKDEDKYRVDGGDAGDILVNYQVILKSNGAVEAEMSGLPSAIVTAENFNDFLVDLDKDRPDGGNTLNLVPIGGGDEGVH